MLATKKITTTRGYVDEFSLFESNEIYESVNAIAKRIFLSDENTLIELNQTIEKDVFCDVGERCVSLVVKFMKSKTPPVNKFQFGIDIEVSVNEENPMYLFKDKYDLELEKYIRTINRQKHLLQ